MKKRILLIGNSTGLPGVKVDINNYKAFFMSDYGGAWNEDEIEVLMNPDIDFLHYEILRLRISKLEYLIVVYSGHGGWNRDTFLEINEKEQTISETRLSGIARKQITILDCCRARFTFEKSAQLEFSTRSVSSELIRRKYESFIGQAIDQQVKLYACQIDETAMDTSEGGVYSVNFLKSARNLNGIESKTVGRCHQEALQRIKTLGYEQNPEAILPRCLKSQELIFSISPNVDLF